MKLTVPAALTPPQALGTVSRNGVCLSYDLGVGPADEGLIWQLTRPLLGGRIRLFRVYSSEKALEQSADPASEQDSNYLSL